MATYLIHLDRPFGHARHYIGFSENLTARLAHHARGTGSNLLRHVREAGIEWTVVRVWPEGDRTFERGLHNRRNAARICPVCSDNPQPTTLPSCTGVDIDALLDDTSVRSTQ